jgi:triacylglycerol esterase/lipase EstA (alpha/beta hydrolase family)
MKPNTTFKINTFICIACILIYIIYHINFSPFILCDSGETINNIVDGINNDGKITGDYDKNKDYNEFTELDKYSLPLFKFKRRLYWYVNSKMKLWDIVKEDFKKTRVDVARGEKASVNSRLMRNIRESRIKSDILRQQNRNIAKK